MWDADCDGYDPDDKSMPCPACNTVEYLLDAKETAEATTIMSSYWCVMTGEGIWRGAQRVAICANPHIAAKAIRLIGVVRPLVDHPTNRAAWVEKFYDHRNERIVVSRRIREGKRGPA